MEYVINFTGGFDLLIEAEDKEAAITAARVYLIKLVGNADDNEFYNSMCSLY